MVLNPLCEPIAVQQTKTTAGVLNQLTSGNPTLRFNLVRTKVLLIMKFTALFLFIAALQVSAKTNGQNISLSEKNASLQKVFAEIEKQTAYSFVYTDALLQKAKKIDVNIQNANLEQVLNLLFKDQPFTYTIVDKVIVVKPKPEVSQKEVAAIISEPPPPIDVRGRVVNENGEPVAGASVKVKGTNTGVTTNTNGEFTMNGVDENASLIISATNIETFEVKVSAIAALIASSGGIPTLTAKIKISSLNEVIVNKGYYKTNKITEVGNVSTVTSKDIEKQPVSNPLLALQGLAPGVVITQANGMPGSHVTVQIRGQNSIGQGNEPFYVIDGVPYSVQALSNLGQTVSGGIGNPLSYLNPSDIESISVLKDADATAIYGSRAANGAILITTKKGAVGQTRVNINIRNGWGKVTRNLDLLNTQQYLEMRHEAKNNDGAAIFSTDYDINGFWDTTRYTNWQKELIGKTAQYKDVQASVSGGSVNTQFLISAGYHKETTVFPGDFSDQKGSLHFNINNVSTNRKFQILLSGNYIVDDNQLPGVDLTPNTAIIAPNAPALYNSDGTLNWGLTSQGAVTFDNPLAYLYRKYKSRTNNLTSNALIQYQILPGLELKTSLGYTNTQTDEVKFTPLSSFRPDYQIVLGNNGRAASFSNNNFRSWIIEPQINYTFFLGKGRFTALLGTTIQHLKNNSYELSTSGFNSDEVIEDVKSASSVTISSTVNSLYKYNAVFGRLNYNYSDKYLINLIVRRDGSSRFGPENQFHNFGAVGLGWAFSKERFIQESLPFLSFGKLRTSYGTTGNDQVGNYSFLDLYSSTSFGTPYQGANGLVINRHNNPNLAWEETRKAEVGLELGFLNDRIFFSTSYYNNRSSNQLVNYALPLQTGFSVVSANLDAIVRNSGWEFELRTTNLSSKNLSWVSSINLSLNRNKLIAIAPGMPIAFNRVVGLPLGVTFVYDFLGVDASTGKYQFADNNGNPTFTPDVTSDQNTVIDLTPKFYGLFQNKFDYKGFQLDFMFYFMKQIGANNIFGTQPGPGIFFNNGFNHATSVMNRWQKPGDVASIQRFNSNFSIYQQFDNAARLSDAAYSDASFIRLRNVSLSWQLPIKWVPTIYLQNARAYIQGQNLLTFTNYEGRDPESRSFSSLPPLKVITVGVQVTF